MASPFSPVSKRMNLALLLRAIADMMDDGDPAEQEGEVPSPTDTFTEPGIRTRSDWMPWIA